MMMFLPILAVLMITFIFLDLDVMAEDRSTDPSRPIPKPRPLTQSRVRVAEVEPPALTAEELEHQEFMREAEAEVEALCEDWPGETPVKERNS